MDWGRLGAGIASGGLSEVYGGIKDAVTNKYQAPEAVTPEQIAAAQAQTQSGLTQQNAFVNALQGQNGIGNQSSVFNQLQGVANGTGPNPAAAALQQATGANIANQASLMAGQRGAGANTGLIARQAAQQGANTQQQAAGQAATLQAQQSLGALNQMGGIAGQQVGQQAGALQGFNAAAQQNQGQLMTGQNAQNQLNAGVAAGNTATQGKLIGGLLGGAGAVMGMGGGGQVSPLNGMDETPFNSPNSAGSSTNSQMYAARGGAVVADAPSSFVGRHLKGLSTVAMAHGGHVDAMLSPGETYVPPSKIHAKDPISAGERIPGKPKVKGNSYQNDTVPKKLEKGGIVIPNSIMQSEDPHAAAAKFVQAVLAKKGLR